MGKWQLSLQDVMEWAKEFEGPQFHAFLSDPPYNLESVTKRFGKPDSAEAKFGRDGAFNRVSKGFRGKTWDTNIASTVEFWKAMYPLLYPGAFGLAYMGTRTYHRVATAIENAGFIIHPMLGWVQSQGFPKATRIDTQIDKRMGVERKVVGKMKDYNRNNDKITLNNGWGKEPLITQATSDEAKIWEDYRYGLQALKPCMEPIIMFQKPYDGKSVDCIVATGAGALNIGGTSFPSGRIFNINRFKDGMKPFGEGAGHEYSSEVQTDLYPTNFMIDEFTGEPYNNFFYQAKAMPKEKNAGLDEKNTHPTIKPISMNKYLATLLLPPKEYSPRRLLNPFSGTGSELIGALLAGWDFVCGIEIEMDSYKIAEQKIFYWIENGKEE